MEVRWVAMDTRKHNEGFTLIELVIVIVIISILAIIATPIYRGYVRRAMATEGVLFANAVVKAQQIYFVEHGEYFDTPDRAVVCDTLGLDSSYMKYFEEWKSCCCDPAYAYNVYVYGRADSDANNMTVRLFKSRSATDPNFLKVDIDGDGEGE